jgi:hypothetical protein
LPLPYILSKVWLAGWLALYQGLVWAAIHFIATGMAGGVQTFSLYGITFFLLAFVGGLLGLLVSALSRSATTITGWLLLLTVPQLLLSGSVLPLEQLRFPFDLLARINPSRYAYEALLAASGAAQGSGMAPAAGHWGALAILSISLIVLLLAIQQGAERRSA